MYLKISHFYVDFEVCCAARTLVCREHQAYPLDLSLDSLQQVTELVRTSSRRIPRLASPRLCFSSSSTSHFSPHPDMVFLPQMRYMPMKYFGEVADPFKTAANNAASQLSRLSRPSASARPPSLLLHPTRRALHNTAALCPPLHPAPTMEPEGREEPTLQQYSFQGVKKGKTLIGKLDYYVCMSAN